MTDPVWIARGSGGRDGTRRYHADVDCEGLAHSHREPRAVARDRVPDHWDPCGYCIGDYERTGSGGSQLADALADPDVTSVADLDPDDLVTDGGSPACPVCEEPGRFDEDSPDEIFVCETEDCLVDCYVPDDAVAADGGEGGNR